MDIAALEARLCHLEDLAAIADLKAQYCDFCDGGWDRRTHDGAGVASLFTGDGIWDAGDAGRAEGHEAIRALVDSYSGMSFAFHRVTNPVIRIEGDHATGSWHVIAYLSQPDGAPWVYYGVYRDRFVRTAEGWRFSYVGSARAFYDKLENGWAKGRFYRQAGEGG